MLNQAPPKSPKSRNELDQARKAVEDLFPPRAAIFWSDLLISAALGWSAFALACIAESLSVKMVVATVVAAIALYRALMFVHELSHLRADAPRGFTEVWNLIVGIPCLFPSFLYVGVHADHHKLSTYGTAQDPEYMPFAGARVAIMGFLAQSLLLPAIFSVRFLVLAPLGILFPPLHHFLERRVSAFSMNPAYYRKVSDQVRRHIIVTELVILGIWAIPIALAAAGILPWRVFLIWYGVVGCISFINALRTLAAHRYRNDGERMDRTTQLLDSIDTPGRPWTILWAPVGLRYHALHHYFPSIPYHNLPLAHQRLIQALPTESPYCQTTSPSLWHSLRTLWRNDKTIKN
ncbi:MAG: fatty acid desaturase [Cyanobacteria bacterium QS_4_48_99]|nr:MAG: fatty acid desaturase [Cyanobacteria bacterium QS_4_48_99]